VSAADPADDLVRAIIARGEGLAREHRHQGEQDRTRILEGSAEKLRLLEEREALSAKSRAEREFRRLVQSSELHMQAELDRLRWALLQSVTSDVRDALAAHTEDEDGYRRTFERLLAEAARELDDPVLVASVNARDHQRLAPHWDDVVARAAPGRDIALSEEILECSGGVRVDTADQRIRVDNTFEGRLERLEEELLRVILARLFPRPLRMEAIFDG
jgi:V/A-type H+-transporting ATPase subunit E